ncbi:MAG: DUF2339 domain-containing protein [Verrucomicrobiales bacterium]|nr:DUF2339 domain-containing protein [Verrucomicrobiales bacterium]
MTPLALLLGFGCLIGLVLLARRLRDLESKLARETELRERLESRLSRSAEAPSATTPASRPAAQALVPTQDLSSLVTAPALPRSATPPPLPPVYPPARGTEPAQDSPPPSLPAVAPAAPPPAFDWERFMGARLFAWLGGLALFLGVAYFVKYSFERGLISPDARVILGLVAGASLVAGGMRLRNPIYAVTSQTLVATGVVIAYGALYSGHALYHLHWLPQGAALAAMTLVTAASIFLATRLNAQVIALLGLLGGFITPLLFPTGNDPGWPFFLYVALLDVGLLVILVRQGWHYQAVLASAGTVVMQWAWLTHHFHPDKAGTLVAVLALFLGLFTAASYWSSRREQTSDWISLATALQVLAAFGSAFWLQQGASGRDHPAALLTLLVLIEAAAVVLALSSPRWSSSYVISGVLAFGVLTAWQLNHAQHVPLGWVLGATLGFTALHTTVPFLLRHHTGAAMLVRVSQLFPALGVVSVIVTFLRLGDTPFALWPTLLVLDLAAIALAAYVGGALGALLTLLASGVVLGVGIGLGVARPEPAAGPFLWMIALVTLVFVLGGGWARRRTLLGVGGGSSASPPDALSEAAAGQLPVLASLMPFLLLAQVAGLVPLPNPVALLITCTGMVLLVLAVTWWLREAWLPMGALLGAALTGHVWWWHSGHLATLPGLTVAWAILLAALLAAFPFVTRARTQSLRWPWIAAALAAIPAFHLTYRIALSFWANPAMGLVPLAFALLPGACLVLTWREPNPEPADPTPALRLTRLAWFGGATLFLITVALPVQFEQQWLTLGFALEGAALLALFRRVPHFGLRLTGIALLTLASARLLGDPFTGPEVLRGPTGILNPWLYTYGVTAAAVFTGLVLLRQEPPRQERLPAAPLLGTLGVALLFLLLNLEIADFFTPVGEPVRFEFSGSFARDMTYTVSWALFALALVGAGIRGVWTAVRWAGLILLAVATVKLFLHDLARLGELYRVGALIGVAAMAIAASALYQRFVGRDATASRPTR